LTAFSREPPGACGGEPTTPGPRADPTRRFSGRAADYERYRPGYPKALLHALRDETGLRPGSVVADVGSGTGISSRMFLDLGWVVHAVEPNPEMRQAAEALLGEHPGFRSVAGTAEDTTLPEASVDFIAAGQAAHWFDARKARVEFARVLRTDGWIAVFWNQRRTASTPFLEKYEALLQRYGTDYRQVRETTASEASLRELFGGQAFRRLTFDNEQALDLAGLRGRLFSSSYVPGEGHRDRAPMLDELGRIFRDHQYQGRVVIEYDAELYFAPLNQPRSPASA